MMCDREICKETSELPQPPPPPPLPPPIICVQEITRSVHVNDRPAENIVISRGRTLLENSQIIFSLTQALEEDLLGKMATLIEEQGVDVNSTLSFGVCILLKAIRCRSTKIVDYLIEKGADPESSIRDLMKRPYGLEVEYSVYFKRYDQWCVDTLKKLLPMMGERLHRIVDTEGRTLLHLACYFPDLSIFEYLLDQGLDPNIKDNRGSTVLSLLISHHDTKTAYEMVQLVLSLPNIQVDIRNDSGSTPLYQSFLMNRLDFFYLLLRKGADPFMRTYSGNTLMHCPFLHSHKYLILYDLGLNVNVKTNSGLRPLQNKAELNFDFFLLILLGREVLPEEYVKMEKTFEPAIVMRIREKVERGEFHCTRLQAMCRQTIRKALFRADHTSVAENVWHLPLPKPLRLYLDVYMYGQHLLDAWSGKSKNADVK
ncbi:poly [ADP-ribose] polymerase tankyrase-2-like isoform X2 [Biomphalaria glabrata]|uniref:Poly [ADP-ribose] polymerase tankyrase-2-like isoform X2 n=1 Tax=Biomphalaria glabrata TaxID=6526 RepID=A0A9W2YFE9_BIOGL|nr:poly [ADP-ribose] polymerase tankyrase-2-like isoform X2 [Biomphalaria glabrata]